MKLSKMTFVIGAISVITSALYLTCMDFFPSFVTAIILMTFASTTFLRLKKDFH